MEGKSSTKRCAFFNTTCQMTEQNDRKTILNVKIF